MKLPSIIWATGCGCCAWAWCWAWAWRRTWNLGSSYISYTETGKLSPRWLQCASKQMESSSSSVDSIPAVSYESMGKCQNVRAPRRFFFSLPLSQPQLKDTKSIIDDGPAGSQSFWTHPNFAKTTFLVGDSLCNPTKYCNLCLAHLAAKQ